MALKGRFILTGAPGAGKTSILHSRYDNAVPLEEGRRLAAAIPDARFVVLESENHVPMPDEPAWATFVAEIQAFLGGE